MERPDVDIFAYTDYRDYLRDYYLARKERDRKFSQRFIMEKVGAGSPSWFNDVQKGRTGLGSGQRIKLARLFGLKAREDEYFELLIQYGQATSLDEKNHYMERMVSFKDLKMEVLGKEKFEYYSVWYHSAIRELLFFYDFHGDFGALARKLSPSIRKEQAEKAIELLLKLELIRKEAGGVYRPTAQVVIKDKSLKYLNLHNYMKANMELAIQALEGVDKEERDISAMTLSLSPEGFQQAKEELKAFRRRLLAIADKDSKPQIVYQCNFQVFPTTR